MRKNSGFTLIELVVVIAVLAILAGVAIPKFVDLTAQAKTSAEAADIGTLRAGIANVAANTAKTGGGLVYPSSLGSRDATNKVIFLTVLEPAAAADFFSRNWQSADGLALTSPNNNTYTYSTNGMLK